MKMKTEQEIRERLQTIKEVAGLMKSANVNIPESIRSFEIVLDWVLK